MLFLLRAITCTTRVVLRSAESIPAGSIAGFAVHRRPGRRSPSRVETGFYSCGRLVPVPACVAAFGIRMFDADNRLLPSERAAHRRHAAAQQRPRKPIDERAERLVPAGRRAFPEGVRIVVAVLAAGPGVGVLVGETGEVLVLRQPARAEQRCVDVDPLLVIGVVGEAETDVTIRSRAVVGRPAVDTVESHRVDDGATEGPHG